MTPDTDIGLVATLDGAPIIAALLKPDDLARRVAAVDRAAERQGLGRGDVADILAGGLAAGRFSTAAERAHCASLLAWLATRDIAIADAARRCGIDLTWHITAPTGDGEPWRLALSVGDRAEGLAPCDHDEADTAPPVSPPALGLH